jgi:predicted phage-related endonuclease
MTMKLIDKPPHGSMEWLRIRHRDEFNRCVFGASEIAALMNASPYNSRADLFVAKRGEPKVSENLPHFYRGQLLEPVLIEEAARRLQVALHTPNVMYRRDRLVATLDGVDNAEQPNLIIEAKTTTRYRVQHADDLPNEWLWQAWAQQAVCEKASVVFVVLDRDQNISLVNAPRNDDACAAIEDEVISFGEMVDSGDEPDALLLAEMNSDHIAAAYTAAKTTIELPSDASRLIEELDLAKAMIAEGKQIEKFARDEIARLLRGNEIGTINGVKAVTWSLVNGRTSLDGDALKQDLPDVYTKYLRRGEPFRTMRIAKQQAEGK